MELLINTIKTNRPKLSNGSINTYTSILSNLYKKINGNTQIDLDFFNNYDTIIEFLKDVPPKNRKTILSSLVIITENNKNDAVKKYRDLMMADGDHARKEDEKQLKTEKQKDNWISFEDIQKIYKDVQKEVSPLMKKQNPTMDDFQRIQNYIILSIYTLIPPRRLLDYTLFKIRNVDKENDNYMEKNTFIFNKYKTAKFYGSQNIEIPRKLKDILKKWIMMNPTDYLLFDNHKKPLNPSKLNQRLNKIFGKKLSVNMIRHIFISDEVLKNIPALEKLKDTATKMAHDINMQMLYKKNE
jgi:hypothetical protein